MRILSKIFEPLIPPFRIRLGQILDPHSKPTAVEVYSLTNTLDLYARTIAKIMGKDASLPTAFIYCKEEALKLFYDLLKAHADRLLQSPPAPPEDLSPPHCVHESMSRLMEIMGTFDESLVPKEERGEEFAPVLSAVIDPLVHACTISATPLRAADMAVYLVNCLSLIENSISAYDFASARVDSLAMHIDSHMDTLVQEETGHFLKRCGLADKLAILQYRTTNTPLSTEPGMDSRSLALAMRSFERSLFELEAMIMPQCDRLTDAQLKATARRRVGSVILNLYSALCDAIFDPKNKYDDPRTIVHYKPEQVKTVIDVL